MSTLKASLERDGYVIVKGLIPSDQLTTLREAASALISTARAGEWAHGIRTAKSPFPPYSQEPENVWGVHNIHQYQFQCDYPFMSWYGSPALTKCCAELMEVEQDQLMMELINMLINPDKVSLTGLPWHRDQVPNLGTAEEEVAELAATAWSQSGIQWNTALFEDSCLMAVPGSHKRPKTDAEREAINADAWGPIPGQTVLTLQPGETVFYYPNILHRAVYDAMTTRVTIHCSMGSMRPGATRRATSVHHTLSAKEEGENKMRVLGNWLEDPQFEARLEGQNKVMFSNLKLALKQAQSEGYIYTGEEDDRMRDYKSISGSA